MHRPATAARRPAASLRLDLIGMDAVEPDPVRLGAIGQEIGERRHMAAGIPFLAIDGASMAADADIEIDDEAEPALGRLRGERGHWAPSFFFDRQLNQLP